MCGVPTQGNVEDESLVIDENIVCRDPVCRAGAMRYLQQRGTQLQLTLVCDDPKQLRLL